MIVEPAEFPEEHESRHIPLVAAFSSMATGTLLALGLLLLALLDTSLNSPDQMRVLTGKDPLATLTRIDTRKFTLGRLFGQERLLSGPTRWIEGIRALRFAVEQSGTRTIAVTSFGESTGKSTTLAGLATSVSKAGKKVLVIDANFKNNTLSAYSNISSAMHPFEMEYNEQQLPKASAWYQMEGIDVVGNMGGFRSLAEVFAMADMSLKLDFFKEEYDYILLEGPALNKFADSRELAEYADGIICVLDAKNKLDAATRESMAWLDAQGATLIGYVLNRVDAKLLE